MPVRPDGFCVDFSSAGVSPIHGCTRASVPEGTTPYRCRIAGYDFSEVAPLADIHWHSPACPSETGAPFRALPSYLCRHNPVQSCTWHSIRLECLRLNAPCGVRTGDLLRDHQLGPARVYPSQGFVLSFRWFALCVGFGRHPI